MFERPLPLPGDRSLLPVNMLSKIKRAKYPAVTPAEENISLPLQTLAQAIFDAVLVHIVNSVSAHGKWQALQQQVCDSLNRRKEERTLSILATTYSDANAIFLQETASAFVGKLESTEELSSRYFVGKLGKLAVAFPKALGKLVVLVLEGALTADGCRKRVAPGLGGCFCRRLRGVNLGQGLGVGTE